jgi:hypothetical protein
MAPDAPLVPLAPTFVVTADEIKARLEDLQRFVKQYMIEGEDYGIIPGTQKPTLYKPGAEKLADVYGLTKEIIIVEALEDWERGRFAYTVKAVLRNKRTGLVEAEGVGSCNSLESRYRWVWVWPDQVPAEYDKATLRQRKIKGRLQYRIPNDDPYSQVNTILKMAKKRALVDAVLSATRSSGLFTQDLEDLRANGLLEDEGPVIDVEGTGDDRPTPGAAPPPAAKPPPARGPATRRAASETLSPEEIAFMKAWSMARDVAKEADLIAAVRGAVGDKQRPVWTPADWAAATAALQALATTGAPF